MNHSASDPAVNSRNSTPAETAKVYLFPAIIALVFALLAAGITAAEWLAQNESAVTYTSTAQQNQQ